MPGGGAWRSRACALAVLLALYLAAAVFISGLHDGRPSYSSRTFDNGLSGPGGSGRQKAYELAVPIGSRLLPGRKPRLVWCSALRFLYPPRATVALASFPGSGNTWLRYLLQQASGIFTGSVYKDYGLLKNGFPAESVVNGSVLVVKTHEWGAMARNPFTKAILLVRAPGPAIQAEFNRQSGGHVGFAAPERYKRMKGKYWQQFVTNKLMAWKQTNMDWLQNFTGPIHVIFYDQLVANVEQTLRGIMDFLNISINRSQFMCALDRKEGIYRRKKRILTFDPYTPQMKMALQHEQEVVYQAIYSAISVTTNKNNNNPS